ncbi:MAG: hypothetical protein EPN97_18400 [Alphaproteobacteria bacterium]|nr:MAG: hypothetical protein EPN97_18400 [Alphaproteobacteria bacterium]
MKNSKLRKAFAVAALGLGIMVTPGFVPQAHAGGSVVAAMAASNAAARRRADDAALNAVMADPSGQNIAALQARYVLPGQAVPFLREALKEMNLPAGLRADEVTEAQRLQLKDIVQNKWRVEYMSAATGSEAVGKGLRADLGKYFAACTEGVSKPLSYDTAAKAEDCLKDAKWEHEDKPALKIAGGVVAGGGALWGAVALAQRLRRRQQGYT